MDSLDGGNGLTTGLELNHVVFDHSFNSWDKVESSGKESDILNSDGSEGHEVVPFSHCDLGISEENVLEPHLFWILASMTRDLVQYDSLLECLVGCSPLVAELKARVSGVGRKIHDWRKWAEISKEKTEATSKQLLRVMREDICVLGRRSSSPPLTSR